MMKEQKKKLIKILFLFTTFFLIITPCSASQEEILKSQSETLNIKGFVDEAGKYTRRSFFRNQFKQFSE